ncbi:MAG TPA: hybrid sensor histidine kinase/response regulator [Roseiflexaceae bacterium]|nr:hybrid sensor histidine kinase/response regulator [Roseiflexaceae bacterium]
MDLSSFYIQFRDETAENLRIYTQGLMAIESLGPDGEGRRAEIDAVFRAMHTIKGSARLLGFEAIGRIAHTCEHILGAIREGRREMDRALTDDLLKGGDAILELVSAAVEGRPSAVDVDALATRLGRGLPKDPENQPPPLTLVPPTDNGDVQHGTVTLPETTAAPALSTQHPPPGTRSRTRQTVRVRVDRLDKLLNLAGELTVGRQSHAVHLQALQELADLVGHQERALLTLESDLRRLRFSQGQRESLDAHINGMLNVGERAGRIIKTQLERFGQYAAAAAQLVEDLEQEVMAVRLLPISTLFANLPRAVRELARDLGREVQLALSGEATELDRKVIEALGDPLTHLLRNALDHGIEPPDERERAGKPRQGTLEVAARALGSTAQITIRDDGRGMDPQQLREAAVRKGLLTADAAALLGDHEAIELIFTPGFSTAQLITDVSGRGVGMDVVRTNIVELGGQVQIESTAGVGTTITLVLPLTLVTTRVLLVEAGGQLFGVPASGCQGSVWVYPEKIRTVEGRAMIDHEGSLAPVVRLDGLLELGEPRPLGSRRVPALLIGAARRPLALIVDRMLDEREVVVKPLGPLMEKQRRYSGAIQLGDGRLALLLNPLALAQMTRGTALAATTARDGAARRHHLLVTDDSFATRELIRSILQSAGYDVTTAVDGLDALDKLKAASYDLVVSDVEMPRVDGFTLTSRIRSEIGRADLPVIIMTSLASEQHRRRGLEVGAQAYIVKSQFNQSNLLETIRQLLGG